MPEQPIPAATIVLLRERDQQLEVLMLRRTASVSFAAGNWVFPGGRIDTTDYQGVADDDAAAAVAALRELQEETSLRQNLSDLMLFAHWTAPKAIKKRFATWFFLAEVSSDAEIIVDGGEIEAHCWYRPQRALEAFSAGQIKLMPPTFVTLTELAACKNLCEVKAFYQARLQPRVFHPRWVPVEGGTCMLYAGDDGYESQSVSVTGKKHRLWAMDAGWRYECDIN